jgi:hypothetical protein
MNQKNSQYWVHKTQGDDKQNQQTKMTTQYVLHNTTRKQAH